MKKHEIKRIIKMSMDRHIPNDPPQMNWDLIEHKRQMLIENTIQSKPRRSWQFVLSLSLATLTLMLMLALTDMIDPVNPISDEPMIFSQQAEALSVSFVSTANLVVTITEPQLDQASVIRLVNQTVGDQPIDLIGPYLSMVEHLISQKQGILIEDQTSDRLDYAFYVTIRSFDLVGEPMLYHLYYNVIDYEEEDDDVSFDIQGIVVLGQKTYDFEGIQTREEDESKLRIIMKTSPTGYVESTYQIEDEEHVYSIKTYENDTLVKKSRLKVEYDQDEIEIQIEIETDASQSSFSFEYQVEDDRHFLEIEYEIESLTHQESGEMLVEVVFDELTGEASYRIIVDPDDEDAYESSVGRKRADEDDDDEDEDDDEEEDEEDDEEDLEDEEDPEDDEDLEDEEDPSDDE